MPSTSTSLEDAVRQQPQTLHRDTDEITKAFQYTPFDDPSNQIRLLLIHPGSWEDEIRCTLTVHDRREAPSYQAVSYTWGDPLPLAEIYPNDARTLVRQNCKYALQQARLHAKADCLIWIDSVCISQDDLEEKGSQVSIMGDIFEDAHSVLACIGSMTESVDEIFNVTEEFKNQEEYKAVPRPFSEYNGSLLSYFGKSYIPIIQAWLETVDMMRFTRVAKAYLEFAAVDYWSRLWVIQEISLARKVDVLCGRRMIPLADLTLIDDMFGGVHENQFPVTWLSRVYLSLVDQTIIDTGLSDFCEYLRYSGRRGPLDFNLSEKRCTDPRDRIYGLLRISEWPPAYGPQIPDYRISTIDLAIDVLTRLGLQNNSLDQTRRLLKALEIKADDLVIDATPRQPKRLTRTVRTESYRRTAYMCDQPVTPCLVIEHHVCYCAIICCTDNGVTCITMNTSKGLQKHTCLELSEDPGTGLVVGVVRDKKASLDVVALFTTRMQTGDILLQLEESHKWIHSEGESIERYSHFCLILRPAYRAFYEIIGAAEVHACTHFFDYHSHNTCAKRSCPLPDRFSKEFKLYVDAEDAIAYSLYGRENKGDERLRNGGFLERQQLPLMNKGFGKTRFSSFALSIDSFPEDVFSKTSSPILSAEYEVNGLPSLDKEAIICAVCGGLFIPDKK